MTTDKTQREKTESDAPRAWLETWESFTRDQIERTRSLYDDFATYEGEAADKARSAINETASIMKSWIDYTEKTFADWRNTSLEKAEETLEKVVG